MGAEVYLFSFPLPFCNIDLFLTSLLCLLFAALLFRNHLLNFDTFLRAVGHSVYQKLRWHTIELEDRDKGLEWRNQGTIILRDEFMTVAFGWLALGRESVGKWVGWLAGLGGKEMA